MALYHPTTTRYKTQKTPPPVTPPAAPQDSSNTEPAPQDSSKTEPKIKFPSLSMPTSPWRKAPQATTPTTFTPVQAPIQVGEEATAPATPSTFTPVQAPIQVGEEATPTEPTQATSNYNSAMGLIAEGLKGPTAGTQAAISGNREALAQAAKNAQGAAAQSAVSQGAIGQGTATSIAQGTRANVLSELAGNEQANTKLVADEQQKFLNSATQAGQFEQNLETQKTQFAQNMDLQRAQLEQNGQHELIGTLTALSADNPTLASKLTNWAVAGGKGDVGEFTKDEIEEMKTFAASKSEEDKKMKELSMKILEQTAGQVDNANRGANFNSTIAANIDAGKLPTTPTEWKTALEDPVTASKLEQNLGPRATFEVPNGVKDYTPTFEKWGLQEGVDYVRKADSEKDWSISFPSKAVVMHDGKPVQLSRAVSDFKIDKFGRNDRDTKLYAIDLTTGKEIVISKYKQG